VPGQIEVTLPDGTRKRLPQGASGADLAASIGKRLAKDAVAAVVDGREADLSAPLPDKASVSIVTADSEEGRRVIRHSTAHVMAQAVLSLWKGARFAIGPAIEDGFYYDFELPGGQRFTDEDLERIEARMREIVSEAQPFVREEHSVAEGLEMFADQPYKREIIERAASASAEQDLAEGAGPGVISAYRNSEGFVDLCRGPHVPSTDRLGAFKLTRVAGAYWRGDERRPQLQRIYGTAWESPAALEEHLRRMREAELRDHRKLGAELDLFHFPPEVGSGLPVFHPKGALLRHLVERHSLERHLAEGYELAWTPHPAKSTLFETSGHLQWYADGMYPPMELEGSTYYLKPMNCPMHILVYRSRSRSYRELPMRLFELGTVYRFERSGVLHGLTRVRGLTQDDAHIFCTREQLAREVARVLGFVLEMLQTFGLGEFEAELSTRPDKFAGDPEEWDIATQPLREALAASDLPYSMAEGEGSFYAPKLDVHLRDAIGRRWQVSTIQVDLQLPRRFDLAYVGADNERHMPCMVHRALFGSVERFLAILLEHYAGALPVWLAPVQARILPVRDAHEEHVQRLAVQLRRAGLRVDYDEATEPLNSRIRRAKLEKLPYVLVVGDDDVASGTVGVNARGDAAPERGVPLDELVARLVKEGSPPAAPAR
jgi:threonyl-tRNA synthetase